MTKKRFLVFKWDDPDLEYKISRCLCNGAGYGIDFKDCPKDVMKERIINGS